MARSLKIKIDGSGSCNPLSPAVAGGTLADNLNGAPSIANFAAINVPVFTWDDRRNEAVVIDPDGEQYPLAEWCQDHQIDAAGQAEILNNIAKEEGTCSACRATFHPSVCLHSESSPFPLIIKNRKLILHVSRQWDSWKEARPAKPWAVFTGIDYDGIKGNNIVAAYLQRNTVTGSTTSSPDRATYTSVPGVNPPHLPWPNSETAGLWPWANNAAADHADGYAVPYTDPAETSETALTLGPREEVLKIVYNHPGVTNESGAAEPLQTSVGHTYQPEAALRNQLHRIDFWFLLGLIPPPKSDPGNPYHYDAAYASWQGDTGPWRMGVYSQVLNGVSRRAFIKLGHQSGTIEAVKTALGSPTSDPLVIGHATPYSDGNLWQQSNTGANAKIPFEDGSLKTALLPADAGVTIPYNLHFAETCWADKCIVTIRVYTGSTTPTRVEDHSTVSVPLANTPVTSGATVATSGAAIEWRSGSPFLVVQLQNKLDHYYDSGLRAEVYALDQDKTFQVEITLQKGKPGIFPITTIADSEEPADFDVFSGYTSYTMSLDIDPETT